MPALRFRSLDQITAPGRAIHDVIETVAPGTPCSDPAGSWLVGTFADAEQAEAFAARCNEFRTVDGISYHVESIDEVSVDRHATLADWKRERR